MDIGEIKYLVRRLRWQSNANWNDIVLSRDLLEAAMVIDRLVDNYLCPPITRNLEQERLNNLNKQIRNKVMEFDLKAGVAQNRESSTAKPTAQEQANS